MSNNVLHTTIVFYLYSISVLNSEHRMTLKAVSPHPLENLNVVKDVRCCNCLIELKK